MDSLNLEAIEEALLLRLDFDEECSVLEMIVSPVDWISVSDYWNSDIKQAEERIPRVFLRFTFFGVEQVKWAGYAQEYLTFQYMPHNDEGPTYVVESVHLLGKEITLGMGSLGKLGFMFSDCAEEQTLLMAVKKGGCMKTLGVKKLIFINHLVEINK